MLYCHEATTGLFGASLLRSGQMLIEPDTMSIQSPFGGRNETR